ncbi:MAG: hypothetical protein WCE76_22815 [Mycobacterium sp.]
MRAYAAPSRPPARDGHATRDLNATGGSPRRDKPGLLYGHSKYAVDLRKRVG